MVYHCFTHIKMKNHHGIIVGGCSHDVGYSYSYREAQIRLRCLADPVESGLDYRQTHIELLVLHILCINIQICIYIYL